MIKFQSCLSQVVIYCYRYGFSIVLVSRMTWHTDCKKYCCNGYQKYTSGDRLNLV